MQVGSEVVSVVEIVGFLKLAVLGKMRDICRMHYISVIYSDESVRNDRIFNQIV